MATVEKRLTRAGAEVEGFRRELAALLQGIRDTEGSLQTIRLSPTTVVFTFEYCNAGLTKLVTSEPVTVTVSGQSPQSGTPNVAGQIGFSFPHLADGTYPYTASIASGRYATYSGSFTMTGGVQSSIDDEFAPASGYICLPRCVYPMKQSLTLSDPNIDKGAGDTFALTYHAASFSFDFGAPFGTGPTPSGPFWYAVRSETYGNCPALGCSSVGATPTLYVLSNSASNQLKVQVYYASNGIGASPCPNPAAASYGSSSWLAGVCPPSSASLQTYTFTYNGGSSATYCGTPAGALTVTET